MSKVKVREISREILLLTVGSVIYAIGIGCFLDPNRIAPGGVAGIAVILCEFIGIDTGLMIFLLNVPLFIAALIRFRGKFLLYTFYALALSSWLIDFMADKFPQYVPATQDLMLAAVAGAGFMAVGAGLVYLAGGSTGGMDILIKFVRQRMVHLKTGLLTTVSDFLIALVSCIAFKDVEIGLYALVTLVVNGLVLDYVLYGGNEAKLVFIVSDKKDRIAERLMKELEIGVTLLDGTGAYTGDSKQVVFTVFRKQIYGDVRDIVKSEDPDAFMIITSASEIFGEGFKDHFADEI